MVWFVELFVWFDWFDIIGCVVVLFIGVIFFCYDDVDDYGGGYGDVYGDVYD